MRHKTRQRHPVPSAESEPVLHAVLMDSATQAFAWITAIILGVLLFFNTRSFTVFEQDKTALLRAFAVGLGTLTLFSLKSRRIRIDRLLLIAFGVYALSWVVSTALSIGPAVSLLGTNRRAGGLLTQVAWWIFGLGIIRFAAHDVRSLARVVTLATAPIAIYALFQALGMDPLHWSDAFEDRIIGMMGNPIPLGACMAMAMPLAWLLMADKATARAARITAGCILALQGTALAVSGSRGPLMGLLAGLVMAVLAAWASGWKPGRLTVMGGAAAGITLIAIVTFLPGGPIARFRSLLDAQSGSSQYRVEAWKAAAEAARAPRALIRFDGPADPLRVLRPWIGYGPEQQSAALDQFCTSELEELGGSTSVFDRAHNSLWDELLTRGVLGALTYVFFLAVLLRLTVRRLRLMTDRQAVVRWWLWMVGACAAAWGLGLLVGTAWIGLLLPAGLLIGLAGFMLSSRMLSGPAQSKHHERHSAIALLSMLVIQLVEGGFGIATIELQLFFWIAAALLASPDRDEPAEDAPSRSGNNLASVAEGPCRGNRTPETRNLKPLRTTVEDAQGSGRLPDGARANPSAPLLFALVGMMLVFDFIRNPRWSPHAWPIVASLADYTLLPLLLIATAWTARVFDDRTFGARQWAGALVWPIGLTLVLTWDLTAVPSLRALSETDLLALTQSGLRAANHTIFAILLLVGAYGLPPPRTRSRGRRLRMGLALILLSAVYGAWLLASSPVQASTDHRTARFFWDREQWQAARVLLKRAEKRAPWHDIYPAALSRAYLSEGRTLRQPDPMIEQAVARLREAQLDAPYDTLYQILQGQLWAGWAQRTPAESSLQRQARMARAVESFEQATRMSPQRSTPAAYLKQLEPNPRTERTPRKPAP